MFDEGSDNWVKDEEGKQEAGVMGEKNAQEEKQKREEIVFEAASLKIFIES